MKGGSIPFQSLSEALRKNNPTSFLVASRILSSFSKDMVFFLSLDGWFPLSPALGPNLWYSGLRTAILSCPLVNNSAGFTGWPWPNGS